MEKNCQKYSLDEKENLAKLCIKCKEEHDKREENEKYSNGKRNLSNPALSRRVSYQKLPLTNKRAEDNECYSISKKVLQLKC